MMMTHIPPFDDGLVRLGRAAELIARQRDDATADDIMDAFKRSIFMGELDHNSAGLQMEIEVPRCTLPPDVAAMTVGPRTLYGVNRSAVASVLLCADALPGERTDWERLFDIAVPDRDEELPYDTLAGIPFRNYPETGRRELEAMLVSKSKLGAWLASRRMLPPSPEPRGRPHKPAWPRVVELVRELHREHPAWQKKQLAFEAWTLARQEFPEGALPSVGTIQRDMVAILGGGSA
ncbi:MAG: hypothetical protein ABL908_17850 [Hyphomicrobium sp.]